LPSPRDDETEEGMRRRTIDMLSHDWQATSHFINRFFFYRGMLANDAQVACHNSAEAFVIWLMGGTPPTHIDERYVEQLETLMGEVRPVDERMSGASYQGLTKPRKRKVKTDV
jgi:hypothetical protein